MYAKIEPSGCGEFHGNVKVRFSFYLESNDARYEECHIQVPVFPYPDDPFGGYWGELYPEGYLLEKIDESTRESYTVNVGGQPMDDEDYQEWVASLPKVWRDTPFHNHFIYADPDVTEDELQALAEFHLANFYKAWRQNKSIRSGWDKGHRIRPLRYEEVDEPDIFALRKTQCEQRVKGIKSPDLQISSLGEGETFPATEIDIGSDAIARPDFHGAGDTIIDVMNSANGTGVIDTVEIYAALSMTGCQVGTFHASYINRDYEDIGAVASGAKRTFSGLDIDVELYDNIGIYYATGRIEMATYGGGLYYKAGSQMGTGEQAYTYVGAYPISVYGTGETVVAPTVTTQAATLKEDTTARINGQISDDGGEACQYRFRYKKSGGSYSYTTWTGAKTTGQTFYENLSGLSTGSLYYFNAQAKNSAGGSAWGSELSFLTKPAAPTNVQATKGTYSDKVRVTWTKSIGATNYRVYRRAALTGWLGDVAIYDDTGAGAPSITKGTVTASDGTYTNRVYLNASGYGTNNGATTDDYYVIAFNATGYSEYSSPAQSGYRKPGTLNRQWQKSVGDSPATYSNISGATSDPYNYYGAPAPTVTPGTSGASEGAYTGYTRLTLSGESANVGAGRYYRAVYTAAGCTTQTTSANRGHRGVGALTRQWYRSAGDSNASYSVLPGATSDPYNDTTAPAPTITKGTITATDGDHTDKVVLDASGYGTNNGAGRYYKCLVSATGATSQYSTANRGYRKPGTLYRQWQKSAADSDASYSNISGATSDPYDYTGAPAPTITPGTASASNGSSTAHVVLSLAGESANVGAGRYYRAVYTAAGCVTQTTSANRGYRGVGALSRQWQRDSGDIPGATTDPYNDTGADAPGTPNTMSAPSASTNHSDYVTIGWSAPSCPNGTTHTYRCKLNADGCAQKYSATDTGYRGAYSVDKYEIKRDTTQITNTATGVSYNDTGADPPTITPGNAVAGDGSSTAYVPLSISGEGTNNGTTHSYTIRAHNASGWASSFSTGKNGYRVPGSLTYQWQRSAADSPASYGNIGGATTESYNDTGAPAPTVTPGTSGASEGAYTGYVRLTLSGESANVGAGRYYRCILNAAGCTEQTTTANRGHRGVGALTRQWYRSAGDSNASYSVLSGATSDPYNDTTAPAPTITPGAADASDGLHITHVALSLSGQSTSVGAGRYYKCLVSATGASSQYSTNNRGYRGVGSLTYQWQRSAADSDASYSNISGATTASYNDTSAPENGDGRYYRCVENATGATQQISSVDRGYRIGAWYGKISGVTNPAKIMGVDRINILTVKGVASA